MEDVEFYFDKEWVYDKDHEVIEVRCDGKSLKKGEKIGSEYVTGFNPDTNTVFLDEDPEVLGGSDYSVEDVFDWKEEQLAKQESLTEAEEVEETEEIENIDQDPEEELKVGDKVHLEGFGEESPWENLSGEIIWMDEEDFPDEFQTITVKVNFPTVDGLKEVAQNFDRRNVIKEAFEDKNESLKEEKDVKDKDTIIDTIEIPHEEYTSIEDIIRINNELDEKAKAGKLLGLRKEKDMLMLAEPAINGIWTLFLNDKGGIIKITLW